MADVPRFYSGKLLLAMPGIGDPRFERSVTALCSHDEKGALGIGITHRHQNLRLHGLLKQFDIEIADVPDAPVYRGGPVEPQRGFVLHSLDWGGQGTIDVAGLWGLSGTIDVLRVIGRPTGPTRWMVALGYAGWGAGQLEGEMLRHGWQFADGSDELLFGTSQSDRWSAAFKSTGIDPRLLSSESGHA
jgi:putative transcriptional regulator